MFSTFHDTLERNPMSMSEMLLAVDFLLDAPFEIVILTPPDGGGGQAMLSPLRKTLVSGPPDRVCRLCARAR